MDGIVAAAAMGALLWRVLPAREVTPALCGLAAAWGASTASVAIVLHLRGAPIRAFMRGFGAGMALRGGLFVSLAAWAWGRPWEVQAPLLASYALGVLGFLLLEYRHLSVKV